MKQNILIVGYDYNVSKRLAEQLADTFGMRTLDMINMFEFDNIPNTFEDVLKISGKDYVEKELRSILKMELDFDNVVFVSWLKSLDGLEDLIYRVKLSNFIILIKKDIEDELLELENEEYSNESIKEFFKLTKEDIIKHENQIEKNCADIVVDISNLTNSEIVQKIIDKIKNYYSVN